MRDLKHLIYFENLLQEANNALVKQAKDEGLRALGYTCYFMPEVLLDLGGCFGVRLRAPRSGSPDIATYYMSGRTCHYGRSLLERALEGGYNFLDAQMATETCTVTCRFQEHLQMMDVIQNPDFFCEFTDVPFKKTANSVEHYEKQLRAHVLDPLREHFGIDISDAALLAAIEQHNEVCALITEIGEHRKSLNPNITGYEFHVIQLVSLTCPKHLILALPARDCRGAAHDASRRISPGTAAASCSPAARTTTRPSRSSSRAAARWWSPTATAMARCPGREQIVVAEGVSPLTAIARHYLETSMCPRFMEQHVMRRRKQYLADLAKEYHADGIVVESNKFCEYWSYERTIDTIVLNRDFGIPVCSIEKEYVNSASGQLRTRFQAFIESIEIKKIQEGK